MKRTIITLTFATILMSSSFASDANIPCPIKADMWVLAGQSNMQGAGKLRQKVCMDPGIMMFNMDNIWQIARLPLHRMFESLAPVHRNIMKTPPEQWQRNRAQSKLSPIGGVGPGLFFAQHLYANGVEAVGLIPSAHGGTSMDQWDPAKKDMGDESLYGAMINRIKMVGGDIKGLLWYQGESDTFSEDAAKAYESKMLNFIDAVRSDTGKCNLPVIFVQIGRFIQLRPTDGHEQGWSRVQESQRRIMSLRKNIYVVPTVDLSLDDLIHISYEGQRRLGKRMAEVALTNVYKTKSHANPIDIESIEYRAEDRTIKVRFSGVTGKLKASGRPADFKITSTDPNEYNHTIAYRTDFDPNDPAAVLLRMQNPPTEATQLSYGLGLNAYCNIIDEEDMAVPAFGPLQIIPPKTTE